MTIARALARSVKLPARLPQVSGRLGLAAMGGLLQGNALSGMAAYRDIGAAYGPIRRICQSVALTDWGLYEQTEQAGSVARELVDDATAPARHPATALWTQPNPHMTRRFFLLVSELWKITGGGVYWLIVKAGDSPYQQLGLRADIELWPIRQDRMLPQPGANGGVAGYWYVAGSERIPLEPDWVVPIGWPDPFDYLRFAGPLQSIAADLEAEQYAAQYTRNTFLNNGRPGGVIEFETPLSQDRFDELVLRWREQHQGVNNVARVAIIEGGKWVDVGQNNRELQYEALRKLDRETVMFALGMPFAIMQTTDVNLANAQQAEKSFSRWTLRPELEDYKEPLNLRVLPLIGENLTMDYDLPSPEDESFDVFKSASGFLSDILTKNEARGGMGYDAVPDGDRYLSDITGTPPAMAKPPKKPTTLSYRKAAPERDRHEATLTSSWEQRLGLVRQQYEDYLASRNGTH